MMNGIVGYEERWLEGPVYATTVVRPVKFEAECSRSRTVMMRKVSPLTTRHESRSEKPVVLRIEIEPTKTLNDVMAIARTEGRKRFGCDVDVTDMDRRSETLFWVEVRPRRKYPSLDVEASKMSQSDL